MRKEYINGKMIPYDSSLPELKQLLSKGSMADFAVACEALSQIADRESFEALYCYLDHKDPFMRRYALEAICRHQIQDNLALILAEKLFDSNIYVIKTALCMIYEQHIKVSKESVIKAIWKNGSKLDAYHFGALSVVITKEDFDDCLNLLTKFSSAELVLAEVIFNIAAEENWRTLYNITKASDKAQLRMIACKLLVKFNCLKELRAYKDDNDGHIRRFADKNLGSIIFPSRTNSNLYQV